MKTVEIIRNGKRSIIFKKDMRKTDIEYRHYVRQKMKIETVKIINKKSKDGYSVINKSDMKKTDKLFKETKKK